jgi:HEAT repeat protein
MVGTLAHRLCCPSWASLPKSRPDEIEATLDVVRKFLGVERPAPELSTVLFTDIVGSTEKQAGSGSRLEEARRAPPRDRPGQPHTVARRRERHRRDPSIDMRRQALAGLGDIDPPESRQVLLAALPDPDQAWFAAVSLGRLREVRAVPRLIEMLSDNDNITVEIASRVLLDIGTPEAIDALHGARRRLPADVLGQLPRS